MKQITWQEAFERMLAGAENICRGPNGVERYRWRDRLEMSRNGSDWEPWLLSGPHALLPWYIKEEPVEFEPGDWVTVNSEGCIVRCAPPQAIGRLSKRYREVVE